MASLVQFFASLGGDDSILTDDANPTTGALNGGHLRPNTGFVNWLKQIVAMMQFVVTYMGANLSVVGTSTTSNGTGTGSKTFTTQAGKGWISGQFLLIAYTTTPSEYMFAQVTSYSGTTLQVNVLRNTVGSNRTAWSISLQPTRLLSTLALYTLAELQAIPSPDYGDQALVNDVGNAGYVQFVFTAGAWQPVNGRYTHFKDAGTVASPLAQISGVTAGDFAIGSPIINPNLLKADSQIIVRGRVRKTGSSGTPRVLVTLGPAAATATDPAILRTAQFSSNSATEVEFIATATLGSSSNFGGTRSLVPNTPLGSGDSSSESINTAIANYIRVGITAGSAGDVHQLLYLSVDIAP